MLETLTAVSRELTVVFPVHPRTRERMSELSFSHNRTLRLLDPLPYLEFLSLQRHASVVITDSGGIQEETTFLGVPCLTVRENTERPITVSHGTNQLVGRDLGRLRTAAAELGNRNSDRGNKREAVPLWDGHAAERIAKIIAKS